ncbi:MAG: hypothetical protein M0C28_46735 [Candidatus Moduliflexus flocculans]|nr:hypothetical protein [Candidatus Moduliflexus flocculans]
MMRDQGDDSAWMPTPHRPGPPAGAAPCSRPRSSRSSSPARSFWSVSPASRTT